MRWSKVTGIVLIVAGCIGFATVADDLRHTGELFGVGGILMAGVMFLVAGLVHPLTRGLALHWVAVGIGVVVGAMIDNLPTGVGGGAALGAIGAAIVNRRRLRGASS